ncbi:MAG: hypothetical protein LKJ25_04355 [Clostridia bacterium]|jgi:hypothetical protein|nr:hypothetical protein [Clostridia bacterium]
MYQLKKFNVIKITDSEAKKDEYLSKGYKLIEEQATTEDKKAKKAAKSGGEDNGTDGTGSKA